MKDYRAGGGSEGPEINAVVGVWAGLRVVISLFGIVVMVVGLSLSVKIFTTVYDSVQSPEATRTTIDGWAHAVGGDDWRAKDQNAGFPLTRLLSIAVLALASLFLLILALKIMTSGARMIMWSAEDRQVVERFAKLAGNRDRESPPPLQEP